MASDPPSTSTGFARWLMVLAAGLVAVIAIGYRVLNRESASEPGEVAVTPSPALPSESSSPIALAPVPPAEPQAAASALEAQPAAPGSAEVTNDEPVAEAATTAPDAPPVPADSAAPKAASPAASASPDTAGTYKVTLTSVPPKVQFYRFGKRVGVAPFVLELPNGERRSYEAGLTGYVTRKVVVDGSKREIKVSLRPN